MGGVNGRMEDMLALPAAPRRPLLRSAPRRAGPAGSTKPGPSGFARPRAALRRLSASGPRHQTLPGVRRLSPAAAAAAAPSSSPSCPALCARRGAHSSSFPVCLSCKLPAGRPGPASTPSFPPKHAHSRRRGRAGRRPARRELRSPPPRSGQGPLGSPLSAPLRRRGKASPEQRGAARPSRLTAPQSAGRGAPLRAPSARGPSAVATGMRLSWRLFSVEKKKKNNTNNCHTSFHTAEHHSVRLGQSAVPTSSIYCSLPSSSHSADQGPE